MARSFQKDLDRIAQAADTSTPEGLHYVLTGILIACLSLLLYKKIKHWVIILLCLSGPA